MLLGHSRTLGKMLKSGGDQEWWRGEGRFLRNSRRQSGCPRWSGGHIVDAHSRHNSWRTKLNGQVEWASWLARHKRTNSSLKSGSFLRLLKRRLSYRLWRQSLTRAMLSPRPDISNPSEIFLMIQASRCRHGRVLLLGARGTLRPRDHVQCITVRRYGAREQGHSCKTWNTVRTPRY